MTIEVLAAAAIWFAAWAIVLMMWRSRRIDSHHAALLLAVTSAVSLGLYSLLRSELNAVIVVVLILWTVMGSAFGRFVLGVFGNDRA